jgi:hypothetical protein
MTETTTPIENLRGEWRPRNIEHGTDLVTVGRDTTTPTVLFARKGKIWVLPRRAFLEMFERVRP